MDKRIRLLLLLLALTGCAGGPIEPPAVDREAEARAALAAGDHARAAAAYLELASGSPSTARPGYQLKAAEALYAAGERARALRLLRQLPQEMLSLEERVTARLLQAEITLDTRDADGALTLLDRPLPEAAERADQARYHALRARAYAHLGNPLEQAREQMYRNRHLEQPEARLAGQEALWDALNQLSAAALGALRTSSPPDPFSGWLALAELGKQYQLSPREMEKALSRWRDTYPHHPAHSSFLDTLLSRSRELSNRPERIALLLPFTGRYTAAANAITAGFLGGYYGGGAGDPPPSIRIYDLGEAADRAPHLYEQALRDGAEMVIGPLRKEAIEALLASRWEFPVPTLALNVAAGAERPTENLYQFNLLPEDEARQVAERAWLEGYGHAAALTPADDWGERVAAAFRERWESLGGTVVSEAAYAPNQSDFSDPITRMLGVAASNERRRQLQQIIGRSVSFEPRRRQDVEFIFLAAFPREARLIRPQIKFHHGYHLPILATSHLFPGTPDPAQDQDMDGILFGDMPWTLGTDSATRALRAELRPALTEYEGRLQRLAALGVDAFHLIPMLPLLEHYPFERYAGETGTLRMERTGEIRRSLDWARFQGGTPRPLRKQRGVATP